MPAEPHLRANGFVLKKLCWIEKDTNEDTNTVIALLTIGADTRKKGLSESRGLGVGLHAAVGWASRNRWAARNPGESAQPVGPTPATRGRRSRGRPRTEEHNELALRLRSSAIGRS